MTEPQPITAREEQPQGVPVRALAISVLALLVPLTAYVILPRTIDALLPPAMAEVFLTELSSWLDEIGLLIWLPALVPAFLLTYHRGWMGASGAVAVGMAAIALTQAGLAFAGVSFSDTGDLLWILVLLIAVSLGAGWMSERLTRARREAEAMALTDGLTGLANRRHLTNFLESAFAAADRGMPLAVVIFDLDRFKSINDEHGHAEGDRVLREFGGILLRRTREMNLSGRWGGEEFLSVLSSSDTRGAEVFAEYVRAELAEIDFGWGHVTVSAGIAGFDLAMGSYGDLVSAADEALYRAKEGGRNRIVVTSRKPAVVQQAPDAHAEEAPAAAEAPTETHEPTGSVPRGSGEVVLVVDDDRDARQSVSRALGRFGYHVLQADGPEEALEIARGQDEPLDLLLTDVVMPAMSGFRLVEVLQETTPDLRVLYMSGYPQEGVDWDEVPGAAATFLDKPMSVEALARAVRDVLDREAGSPPEAVDVEGRETVELEASAEAQRGGRPAPDPEVANARVLVVDDDKAVIRSLGLLLGRCGVRTVRGTTDPADLPVHLARFQPDLILLDMNMPGVDGLEVLSALSELDRDTFLPVVVITGETDPDLRRRSLAAGASDFVTKPVEAWELEPRLRNLLRIRSMTEQLAEQAQTLESRVAARTADLKEAQTAILLRLARAAEYRDDQTGLHAERVGILAGLLAEALGVSSEERDTIQRAAPLHDVGKIGVPDDILRKRGELTDEELAIMRNHTEIGAEILSGSRYPLLRMARTIAMAHHERWDGSGYPRGLAGEQIPLPARIVAVADVFDSLSHPRPYRKALPEESALRHLREGAGTLFDPVIVEALEKLHREGRVSDAEAVEVIARPDRDPGGDAERDGVPDGSGSAA